MAHERATVNPLPVENDVDFNGTWPSAFELNLQYKWLLPCTIIHTRQREEIVESNCHRRKTVESALHPQKNWRANNWRAWGTPDTLHCLYLSRMRQSHRP